ncbi:MAG: FlgD immunoglobulin-like domain containing protein, partial [Candidatus Poribacteria bacterium]
WQFTYTLPIVTTPTEFAFRSAWARDKTTGDADGQAEPGESVEVRVRLKNEGHVAGENVAVILSTEDENATVAAATVTHATWPAGDARNNVGLLVDLGADVGASVAFVVDVTADNAGPWQFTFDLPVSAPAAPAALAAPEDIDLDGVVGIRDILTLAPVYGQRASAFPIADLNGDQLLDLADMVAIESARADVLVGAPSARRGPAGLVERWLLESRATDDGSAVFRRGIAALEGILAELRPATTALLPNYPNPFNPETWIPFDLSEDADVTVRIYDVQGRQVRGLTLGRLAVGMYQSRERAAYWDGRNDIGEAVASGVYVYELRADGAVQRRRMVIRK